MSSESNRVWFLRVAGALVTVAALLLSPQNIVGAFLPSGYERHAEFYIKGLSLFRIMLIIAAVLAAGFARRLVILFSTDNDRPADALISSDRFMVAALFISAVALRLIHIRPSFTYDEVFLVKSLILQDPIRIFVHPSGSSHALHTLFSNLVVRVVGISEWAARSPALIFGAAAPAMLFLFLRRQVSRSAGIIGAVILIVTPIHVWFSQEAKGNVPQMTMILWSWLCIDSLGRRWNAPAAFGLVASLCLSALAHLSGVIFLVGQALAMALAPPGRRPRRGRLVSLHAIALYIVLLYYSVIAYFLMRGGQNVTAKEGAATVASILRNVIPRFTALDLPAVYVVAPVVIALAGAWYLARHRRDLLVLTCLPFVLGVGITVGAELFSHARYHTFFLPGLTVLIAMGLAWPWMSLSSEAKTGDRSRQPARALGVLALVLIVGTYLAALGLYFRYPKSNVRQLAEYVRSTSPGQAPYVIGPNKKGYPALAMTFYLDDFHTDDTVLNLTDTLRPETEMLLVVIDTLHFETAYPHLSAAVFSAGKRVESFTCLGELDQYRVRGSWIYRVASGVVANGLQKDRPTASDAATPPAES